MAANFSSLGPIATGVSDLGSAVSDLFGSKAAGASASSYQEAQAIADQNAKIAAAATNTQEMQETRALQKSLGTTAADVSGAGFASSGSALDIVRDSAMEGALNKALTAEQGAITVNSYEEQAGMFGGMAEAANASGTGQLIGGVLQAAGGVLSLAPSAINAYKFITSPSAADTAINASSVATVDAATAAESGTAIGDAAAASTATVDAATAAESGTAIGDAAASAAIDAGATDAVAAGATDAVATGAVAAGGDAIATDAVAAAAWIVCTELHRQGRMASRTYYAAASSFLAYPERGKRGYYVWAIPSTRHLRAHPQSWYSRLLERTFNCRANYIVAKKRRRQTTLAGAMVTHGLYAFCWTLSWFVPESFARWQHLYEGAR